jgi:addiction module RelE/StbE family toxin
MKVIQSPLFLRKVKKLNKNQKLELDKFIKKLIKDPEAGQEKTGDLKGIFVYKFKLIKVLYLLSYRIRDDSIELITIGPHENYYRDLKTYLKSQ